MRPRIAPKFRSSFVRCRFIGATPSRCNERWGNSLLGHIRNESARRQLCLSNMKSETAAARSCQKPTSFPTVLPCRKAKPTSRAAIRIPPIVANRKMRMQRSALDVRTNLVAVDQIARTTSPPSPRRTESQRLRLWRRRHVALRTEATATGGFGGRGRFRRLHLVDVTKVNLRPEIDAESGWSGETLRHVARKCAEFSLVGQVSTGQKTPLSHPCP